MRPTRKVTAKEDNARVEELELRSGGSIGVIRRDPVEPEPVGSVVLMAFRITGYDKDYDGSLMVRADQIGHDCRETGWSIDRVGLDGDAVVVSEEEWKKMCSETCSLHNVHAHGTEEAANYCQGCGKRVYGTELDRGACYACIPIDKDQAGKDDRDGFWDEMY